MRYIFLADNMKNLNFCIIPAKILLLVLFLCATIQYPIFQNIAMINFKFLLSSLLFVLISIAVPAQQTASDILNEKWKTVNELIDQGLPESAIKELNTMKTFADNARLIHERIKIQLHEYRLMLEINRDDWQTVLRDSEAWVNSLRESPEKSIALFVIADFYSNYYQSNRYRIEDRTETNITVLPEDISIWTKENFIYKINQIQENALINKNVLQRSKIEDYSVILDFDPDAYLVTPTVFDVLMYHRIESLGNLDDSELLEKAYQEYFNFLRSTGNRSLLIHLDLNYHTKEFSYPLTNANLQTLDSLERLYHDIPEVIEIMHAKAEWFMEQENTSGNKRIAYRICEDGVSKFPDYHRINLLKNIQTQIQEKKVIINHPSVVGRNKSLNIKIGSTNINELILEIHQINNSAFEIQRTRYLPDNIKDTLLQKKLIDVKIINIPFNPDFENTDIEYSIQLPGYGVYELVAYPKDAYIGGNTAKSMVTVSDLTFIVRALDNDRNGIYVLDRFTGQAVRGAEVTATELRWESRQYVSNTIAQKVTDKNGYAELPVAENHRLYYFNVSKGNDTHLNNSISLFYPTEHNIKPGSKPIINIFTDRKVYRPGQTVYFKAIAYYSSEEKELVSANEEITVKLFDKNRNEVSSKEIKTNEFGSASAEFIIPEGGLNGTWHLSVDRFQTSILVEEYKLPTFEVLLTKPTEAIRFGSDIIIDAEVKAYAGYALPGSTVKYRIHRITHPFWRFIPRSREVLVESGETISDASGKFSISFKPEKDNNLLDNWWGRHSYIYRITTDVTDLRGETQQGVVEIPVSEQSVFINVRLESLIERKANHEVKVDVLNILGENVSTQLNYYLEQLANTDEYDEKVRNNSDFIFQIKDTVLRGQFHSSQKSIGLNLSKLPVGRYRLKIKTTDDTGTVISQEKIFVLYNPKDKRPAVKSYVWANNTNIECKPGENAVIQFGTSVNKANILMEVMSGNKVISSRWIRMSNTIRTFRVPFKKEYKDGLTVNFTFVRDEQLFVQSYVIREKQETKTISPQLKVFRDKLSPGEHSEWTVIIPDAGKRPAELMLSMYDASLDIFAQHAWLFNPNFKRPVVVSPPWRAVISDSENSFALSMNQIREIPDLELATPNSFGFSYEYGYGLFMRGRKLATGTSIEMLSLNVLDEVDMDHISQQIPAVNLAMISEDEFSLKTTDSETLGSKPTNIIRSNFNETAFFYPQVYADSLGNYRFSFTIPESLTRWNLKMLAHTKDLYHGQAQVTVTTTKDLMIRLNKPRFIRESDETVLSASVINLSDTEQTTKVKLVLTDTRDNSEIKFASAKEQIVVLQPGQTKAVHWEIGKLKNRQLLICTVEAASGQFSDGEQYYLAVLPDRVMVTESQSFSVSGNTPTTLNLEDWKSKSADKETHAITLEFSSNPLWYAIQALPVLAETQSENSIDLFMQYFARTKAMQLLNENPEITAMFKMLEEAGKGSELTSALKKNEDLKNLLLQETPWVNDAKNETEAMQRIRLLFNQNRQHQDVKKFFDLLAARQLSNGSFAWYPGMQSNRWISQSIAEGLTHIYQSQTASPEEKRLIRELLQYLDGELNRDYEEIKRQHKDYLTAMYLNPMQLQYLVIRSFFAEFEKQQQHVEAYEYFLRQADTHRRRLGIYEKALAAKVLYRSGRLTSSTELLNSLRETAVKSASDGMYWADNRSGYRWNERPISVHAAIMQTFSEISGASAELEMMKIWLLRQKQTQHWNSPVATLHAIAALTGTGEKMTTHKPGYQIKVNERIINENQSSLGAAYIRYNIEESKIPESIRVISSPETSANKIAWGAVYWQYFTDLDKITASGQELRVSKTYFTEQIVNNQSRLVQIDKLSPGTLRPGDRIVTRLVVSTERDLEFVALKDLRASCLEPENQLSETMWRDGVSFYRTVKDASTQYFFNYLPKGSYVFEDTYFITNTGEFSGGMASIQCLYAPEFKAHDGGQRLVIK